MPTESFPRAALVRVRTLLWYLVGSRRAITEIAEIIGHELDDGIPPIAYFVCRRIKHFHLVCVAPMALSAFAPTGHEFL